MVTIAIGQMAYTADVERAMEVRLNLGSSTDETISEPFKKQPPPMHRVTVTKHRRVPGPPPRQRHPELSSEQLVIVAFDAEGREITRVVIADPRLIRAETLGPSGELTSKIFYRESAEFTIVLPDDPNITTLKIYHPYWTGIEFVLKHIGETQLP